MRYFTISSSKRSNNKLKMSEATAKLSVYSFTPILAVENDRLKAFFVLGIVAAVGISIRDVFFAAGFFLLISVNSIF